MASPSGGGATKVTKQSASNGSFESVSPSEFLRKWNRHRGGSASQWVGISMFYVQKWKIYLIENVFSWFLNVPWHHVASFLFAIEGARGLSTEGWTATEEVTVLKCLSECGLGVIGRLYYMKCLIDYVIIYVKLIAYYLFKGGRILGLSVFVTKIVLSMLAKRYSYHLDVVRVSHNFIADNGDMECFDFQSPCGDVATANFFTNFVTDTDFMTILWKFIQKAQKANGWKEQKYVVLDFDECQHSAPWKCKFRQESREAHAKKRAKEKQEKYKELKNRAQQKAMELFHVDWLKDSKAKRVTLVMGFVYESDPHGGAKKVRLMTIKETDLKKCYEWMQYDKEQYGENKYKEYKKTKEIVEYKDEKEKDEKYGPRFHDEKCQNDGPGMINPFEKRLSRWRAIEKVFVDRWLDKKGNAKKKDHGGLFHIEVPESTLLTDIKEEQKQMQAKIDRLADAYALLPKKVIPHAVEARQHEQDHEIGMTDLQKTPISVLKLMCKSKGLNSDGGKEALVDQLADQLMISHT